MANEKPEIRFGIGTVARDGKEAVAVVVNDRVALLSDIVARRGSRGETAPIMRDLMPEWERWHGWLRGLGLDSARDDFWAGLDAVKWMPPVPEPWNIFSTYHNYERPSRVTGRSDPPKAERILPDIFFGSRSSLAGYGDTVYREHGGHQFDFEVEVTIIIGKPATRVKAEQAEDYIAGYVISNDLTMHRAWWRPIRDKSPINDNIRMKNFPGYTPVSRVIVPRDLAGDPHDLGVKAWVGGQLRQDTRTKKILWHMGELVEYLSHIFTLHPGDMILTGSPEELPLPEGATRGILPGQAIVCEVENLGRLENTVAEQSFRQPHEI